MAQALIPLLADELQTENGPMCNARDLHKALQVETRFNDWIARRIEEYGFVDGEDFYSILSKTAGSLKGGHTASQKRGNRIQLDSPKRGIQNQLDSPKLTNQVGHGGDRRRRDYHLTLDMAKELAMIENNPIGQQVRRYFIRAEQALRERLLAELKDKAAHVLPVRGVRLMRDGLNMRDTFRLQEQARKVFRLLSSAQTPSERQNLHYHLRQINLTLGVPTIELDTIEADLAQRKGRE